MPYYLMHAGSALQKVSVTGNIKTLTLPAGVTVSTGSARRARMAMLEKVLVIVNAPSVNLALAADTYSLRKLNLQAPGAGPTATASGTGSLKGTYRYRFSFVYKSGATVLSESKWSTASAAASLTTSQGISVTNITTSADATVTGRRLYRTTNNGNEYYKLTDIDDNTTTTFADNLSDYDLALLAVTEPLGNPPGSDTTNRLRLIVSWKDRLWGAPSTDPDRIYYSANRIPWNWLEDDYFTAKPPGEDDTGVLAFMARRDELVWGKRRRLGKIIGSSRDNFQVIIIAEGIGTVSQEASIVVRDVCYFLAEDGFYEYGPQGVMNLSRDQVHDWFTTDTYFNRAYFPNAFAKWNPKLDVIELHLPAAGGSDIDRWVSYDLKTKIWLGPHKTAAFTPSMGALMEDASGYPQPILGSTGGYLYVENSSTASDDGTAIDMDVMTKWFSGNTPDITKYFGQLAVVTAIETTGSIVMTPYVGGLDAAAGSPIVLDLTAGRSRTRRLGRGRFVKLRFQEATNNQNAEIYGLELPFHELGRR
jgi:hypothetical protein